MKREVFPLFNFNLAQFFFLAKGKGGDETIIYTCLSVIVKVREDILKKWGRRFDEAANDPSSNYFLKTFALEEATQPLAVSLI